jgi:hypothetical protein
MHEDDPFYQHQLRATLHIQQPRPATILIGWKKRVHAYDFFLAVGDHAVFVLNCTQRFILYDLRLYARSK